MDPLQGRLLKVSTNVVDRAFTDYFIDEPQPSSSTPRVGRFGVIAGEAYSSPRASRKRSSHAKLVKEPTDHSTFMLFHFLVLTKTLVPIYDLTDGHLDPKHDMLNVDNTRVEVPGIEVPQTEPVLVTFYISKWNAKSMHETNIDFNLQWVGLLSTDVPSK